MQGWLRQVLCNSTWNAALHNQTASCWWLTQADKFNLGWDGLLRVLAHFPVRNHRMIRAGRDLQDHLVPIPAMGRHLPWDQEAPNSIQPGLEEAGVCHCWSLAMHPQIGFIVPKSQSSSLLTNCKISHRKMWKPPPLLINSVQNLIRKISEHVRNIWKAAEMCNWGLKYYFYITICVEQVNYLRIDKGLIE